MGVAMNCLRWMKSEVLHWIISGFLTRPTERKCYSVGPEDWLRPLFKAIVYSRSWVRNSVIPYGYAGSDEELSQRPANQTVYSQTMNAFIVHCTTAKSNAAISTFSSVSSSILSQLCVCVCVSVCAAHTNVAHSMPFFRQKCLKVVRMEITETPHNMSKCQCPCLLVQHRIYFFFWGWGGVLVSLSHEYQ